MKVSFHARGRADYVALVREYASIRRELGVRVVETFGKRARVHAEWPDVGRHALKNYRYFTLGRFPYKVFYKKTPTGIAIMTICHNKRHPRVWRSFLRNA